MVVSVVTQGLSDDCNSFVIDRHAIWLRVSRVGHAYAFHESTDGSWWHLVRHFGFAGSDDVAVGFLAQSPLGEQCTARFAEIRFLRETLLNLRDGS
jgi:regulation of enolase protein 1 (concanavalin A-like superfamily)